MPAYLVSLPETSGQTLFNGCNAFVVFAEDGPAAEAIVKDVFKGDSDALVTASTPLEIVERADLEDFTIRVQINDPTTPIDVSYVGVASDALDDLGDGIVVALIAAGVAGAAYDSGTNTLTAADSTDNLGDNALTVTVTGPNGNAAIPGFVGTITDLGVAAADLTAVLAADTYVLPQVVASLKQ